MIKYSTAHRILVVVAIIVIFYPYEPLVGRYATPEAAVQAKKMEPVLWIHSRDERVAFIVERTDDSGIRENDISKYSQYYMKKRILGWTIERARREFSFQGEEEPKAFTLSWKHQNYSILILDTKPHKVTATDGTPYEQHEFMQGEAKVYVYISPIIHSENAYEEMVMIDWRKVRLRDIILRSQKWAFD
jgi:hypothetical protein